MRKQQLIQFRIDLFLFLMQELAQLQHQEKETGNNKPTIKKERKLSLTFICNTHALVGAGSNQTSVKCEPLDSPSAPAQGNIQLYRKLFPKGSISTALPISDPTQQLPFCGADPALCALNPRADVCFSSTTKSQTRGQGSSVSLLAPEKQGHVIFAFIFSFVSKK